MGVGEALDIGEGLNAGEGPTVGEGLSIRVPGDKSITQRALIFGALAEGESRIGAAPRGADPLATAGALAALGVEIRGLDGPESETIRIRGIGLRRWTQPRAALDLRNSGTGTRLLAGALAAQPLSAVLTGDESLSRRPMERIASPLRRMGATVDYVERPGVLPMRVTGCPLTPIRHDGAVASAQVKSAILLAGLGAGVPVEVREPRRSRDHSERMLEAMGVEVAEGWRDGAWSIRLPDPPARLAPLEMDVPGDFSSAAFFLAWAVLAAGRRPLTIRSVGLNPTRTGLLPVLGRMGLEVDVLPLGAPGGEPVGDLRVGRPARPVRAVNVGEDEIPGLIDEVPILAVLAARADGVTRITGARELRVKESDRLAALAANLRRIGVGVEEYADGLAIEGTRRRLSGRIECFRDHRIAMAFGILGATPECDLEVDDPEVAGVSFPGFWELLAQVGGQVRPSPCVVVAIDGSAGAGKSTTAAAVASRLGFRHMDSGAIYRAATLALLESGPGIEDVENVMPDELLALEIGVAWGDGKMEVRIRGERVPERVLRADRVTAAVSRVSAVPLVRAHLLALQRDAAEPPGLVAEGRDMATVVFPDAEVKVYLDADIRERARRRILQRLGHHPGSAEIAAEAARLEARDRLDSSRAVAPLARAQGAVTVDTTHLDPTAQIDAVVGLAEASRCLSSDATLPTVHAACAHAEALAHHGCAPGSQTNLSGEQ